MVKPRHAAAIALVGCYLMVPPARLQHATRPFDLVRPNAPLSEWTIWKTFDSAKDCEHQKAEEYREGSNALKRLQFPRNDAQNNFYAEMKVAKMFAECIATDDPRLKGK